MADKKPFYDEPFTPVSKLSKADLQKEVTNWRNQWGWLDNEVKGWLTKAGNTIKFVRRDYRVFFGRLGIVHFRPENVELDCIVEEKDYIHKKLITEVETLHIGINQLIDWEEVHQREELPLDDLGQVKQGGEDEKTVEELMD